MCVRFPKQKVQCMLAVGGWCVVGYVASMIIRSRQYIISQYKEWFEHIEAKNGFNQFSLMQNVSLLGMVRKFTQCASYSDLCLIIPGLALFGLPSLRFNQYKNTGFIYSLFPSLFLFVF